MIYLVEYCAVDATINLQGQWMHQLFMLSA